MDPASNSDQGLNFLKSLTLIVVMFGIGFAGSIAYFRLFVPPQSPPTGQLLGITDTAPEPTSPPLTPAPDLSLSPKELSKPPKGQIIYLKGDQIYQVNADRTQNLPLTTDNSHKTGLVISPDKQLLVYAFDNPNDPTATHGIGLYNFKDKKTDTLLATADNSYQSLIFSPNNRYLSAWNANGQEAIIIDISSKNVILKYTTDDQSGISPIVWAPVGNNAVSFILKGELFTGNVDGTNLKSLSKNVVGVKTDTTDHDIPVPPVWSDNGRYVSYLKRNGLYLFDVDTQTESAVVTATQDFDLDQIPYQAFVFTNPEANLIYQSLPDETGKNVYLFSVKDKTSKVMAAFGATSLLNSPAQTLYGLVDTETLPHLSVLPLSESQAVVCDSQTQSYPIPPYANLINSTQKILLTLTHEATVYTLKITYPDTCTTYDLIKSTSAITDPLWLTN